MHILLGNLTMVRNISGINPVPDFSPTPSQKEIKEPQTPPESPLNSLDEALKILQKLPESLANLLTAEKKL